MSSIGQVVNQNSILSRINFESKTDTAVIANTKDVRMDGQNHANETNVATAQNKEGQAGQNQEFAHQHHIALNAYRNFGKTESNSEGQAQAQTKTIDTAPSQSKAKGTIGFQNRSVQDESHAVNEQGKTTDTTNTQKPASSSKAGGTKELTEEELKEVEELKKRDKEVRDHELAHKRAGGQYAANPTYEYESGPDGKKYATSGEVKIDVSKEDDPQDTIEKMQIVKRAALAPAEPSGQDRRVYNQASEKERVARQDLAEDKQEEAEEAKEAKAEKEAKAKESAEAREQQADKSANANEEKANANADAKAEAKANTQADIKAKATEAKTAKDIAKKMDDIPEPSSSETPQSLSK